MRTLLFLTILVLSCFSPLVQGKDIGGLIRSAGLEAKNFSLLVKGPKDTPILELNSEVARIPASLTKILTASAVLAEFPKDHKFVTELRSSARIQNGVLEGDLHLVGDGDPAFVSESLWNLVNSFYRSEVKEIHGDLIVDDSKFDQVHFDGSRSSKRVDRAYDSPVGAMSFNWNSVNVFVSPGASVGQPVKVHVDPVSDYFRLVNKAKTGEGTENSLTLKLKSASPSEKGGREVIEITGEYGVALKEKVHYRAVEDPAFWSLYNLRSFLKERGITVKGELKKGTAPLSARQLAQWKSRPIDDLVKSMMKFSNNFVAESLIKNLGALRGSRPASLASGGKVMMDFVRGTLLVKDIQVPSPSGFSRDNRLSSQQLVQILEKMKGRFGEFPEFINSFPVGGIDGTLKSRMKTLPGKGIYVRAKTGMLNGAIGLAGYMSSPAGDIQTFAFIYNGPHKNIWKARDLLDQIVEHISLSREINI